MKNQNNKTQGFNDLDGKIDMLDDPKNPQPQNPTRPTPELYDQTDLYCDDTTMNDITIKTNNLDNQDQTIDENIKVGSNKTEDLVPVASKTEKLKCESMMNNLKLGFVSKQKIVETIRHPLGKSKKGNEVWKCKDNSTGEIKAVKIMPFKEEDQLKQKQFREFNALDIKHKNILKQEQDFQEVGNKRQVVMDLAASSLQKEIDERQDGIQPKRKDIIRQIVEAVGWIHENNIMHRNLKPTNILLDSEMNVLVSDFTISREIGDDSNNIIRTKIGSEDWAAPEQRGKYDGKYDRTVDMWTIGMLVWQFTPFFHSSKRNFKKHFGDYREGKGMVPEFEREFPVEAALICQLANLDPNKRPYSCSDIFELDQWKDYIRM